MTIRQLCGVAETFGTGVELSSNGVDVECRVVAPSNKVWASDPRCKTMLVQWEWSPKGDDRDADKPLDELAARMGPGLTAQPPVK